MSSQKDSAADKVNQNSGFSLDWAAVTFALVLAGLVFAGLQVTW